MPHFCPFNIGHWFKPSPLNPKSDDFIQKWNQIGQFQGQQRPKELPANRRREKDCKINDWRLLPFSNSFRIPGRILFVQWTIAWLLVPPSHNWPFPPLNGQFDAPNFGSPPFWWIIQLNKFNWLSHPCQKQSKFAQIGQFHANGPSICQSIGPFRPIILQYSHFWNWEKEGGWETAIKSTICW